MEKALLPTKTNYSGSQNNSMRILTEISLCHIYIQQPKVGYRLSGP